MGSTVQTITIPIALAALLITASCAKRPPAAEPASLTSRLEATMEDKKIIVVRVNGTELTNYALIDMMNRIIAIDLQSSHSGPMGTTRKRALDILVLQELAIQDSLRKGLIVEDALIDRAVEQFISKLGHAEGYTEYLARNHLTTVEFRAQVERSLRIQRILTEEVIKKVLVTDDDIKQEYERTRAKYLEPYLEPEKVAVVDIAVPRKQDGQAAMKKAQELFAAITADRDKDPSHLVSDATFSVRVAELDKGREPALYETARTLKAGEISGVITDGDAFHLLKLTEFRPARQRSYEEVRNTLEGTLKTAASTKRREEWEQSLKKEARIVIMNAPAQHEQKMP